MNDEICGKKRFALIGNPLGHSMSPFIHKALCRLKGLEISYDLTELKAEELETAFRNSLCRLNGFNVTIPHKLGIIPLLDALSEKAALFGAVNTVHITGEKAIGYNTDCEGFLRSLRSAGIALGGSVLICGCGGVSRMFAFESVMAGAGVTLAVRQSSREKAALLKQELADKLSAEVKIISLDEANGGYDLIINGTPAGMFPNVESCPLSEAAVKNAGAVFDAVYNPLETRLIKYAKEAGLPYVNGLPMLVWQAAVAEEIWNGVGFSEDEVKQVIALTEKELEKR